jgi:hypothetical protein
VANDDLSSAIITLYERVWPRRTILGNRSPEMVYLSNNQATKAWAAKAAKAAKAAAR